MKQLYALTLALATSVSAFSQISISPLSTYATGVFDEGAAEIVTYDPGSAKLFFSNADDNSVGILDISDPTNPILDGTIDMDPYGDGVNSVSVYDGIVAVASEAGGAAEPGLVVFFDEDGTYINDVEVGVLPDGLKYSPDGAYVVVACEAEPDDEWLVDAPGTIAVIDMSAGAANLSQNDVTLIGFENFTLDPGVRIFGLDEVHPIDEDFQDTLLGLNNFQSISMSSNRDWFHDDFSGDYFAEMNSFGGDTFSQDWLVSPAVDLSTFVDAEFEFANAKNFSGGTLDLLVSVDYDGSADPSLFTWDTLTSQAIWSTGGYVDTLSGPIDLGPYLGEDEVTIAFYYTGDVGGGTGTLWQLDDMTVTGWYDDANNVEPEYVAIDPQSSTAFVTLQENNAIAIVDLSTATLTDVVPLGYKDHSATGNGLDASNQDNGINIQNWPFWGMYQPDAASAFEANGNLYIATANEGDARDYDGYSEEDRLNDITLDPTVFPNAAMFQPDSVAGRINITLSQGDIDDDGDYDEIYTYGARSFSIWDDQGNLVYDSGDDFEQQVAADDPDNFNSTNDDNDSFDNRSDDKGPEPEAITVANLGGEIYAFIGLERMGGVMVYDLTDPTAPVFIEYVNNRDFDEDATTAAALDLAPEDLVVIPAATSPDGGNYLVSSNEVSGTVTIWEISGVVSVEEVEELEWRTYPNPAVDVLRTNVKDTYVITDLSGRVVRTEANTNVINVTDLSSGAYLLSNSKGETRKFLKQ